MPEPRTARQIAKALIADVTEDIEIGEFMDAEHDTLGDEAADTLRDEVDDLIRSAVVTVTFPGDPEATIQAQLLRDFADLIDRGPDVPLRPSIYSALARETADRLDGQADHG